jgi:hypothetical protein
MMYGCHIGDARTRSQAKRTKLELLDEHIRNAFDEQSRILVTFQLRIIVGANVWLTHSTASQFGLMIICDNK